MHCFSCTALIFDQDQYALGAGWCGTSHGRSSSLDYSGEEITSALMDSDRLRMNACKWSC